MPPIRTRSRPVESPKRKMSVDITDSQHGSQINEEERAEEESDCETEKRFKSKKGQKKGFQAQTSNQQKQKQKQTYSSENKRIGRQSSTRQSASSKNNKVLEGSRRLLVKDSVEEVKRLRREVNQDCEDGISACYPISNDFEMLVGKRPFTASDGWLKEWHFLEFKKTFKSGKNLALSLGQRYETTLADVLFDHLTTNNPQAFNTLILKYCTDHFVPSLSLMVNNSVDGVPEDVEETIISLAKDFERLSEKIEENREERNTSDQEEEESMDID